MDKHRVGELADQLENALGLLRRTKHVPTDGSGLSMPERFLLSVIASEGGGGPVMPSEIAKRMGVTSAAVTHHLEGLEERGLISRSSSPDDRRVLFVSLTKAGKEALLSSRQAMRERLAGLVEHLGETDVVTLVSLLNRIGSYMDEGGPA